MLASTHTDEAQNDSRVASHDKGRIGASSHDLANHLRHQFASTSIATDQKARNIRGIRDALDGKVLGTAHHLSQS